MRNTNTHQLMQTSSDDVVKPSAKVTMDYGTLPRLSQSRHLSSCSPSSRRAWLSTQNTRTQEDEPRSISQEDEPRSISHNSDNQQAHTRTTNDATNAYPRLSSGQSSQVRSRELKLSVVSCAPPSLSHPPLSHPQR